MESVTSALSILPSSKEQVTLFGTKLLKEIGDGTVNPLEIRAMKAYFDKMFESIKTDFDLAVREEAEKYGKTFEYKGVKMELAEVGTKYDFTVCKDHELDVLVADADVANAKVKARQDFLKALKEPLTFVYDDTGEVITVYPPLKTSTSSVKVTLK
jgi:hypothetical protein